MTYRFEVITDERLDDFIQAIRPLIKQHYQELTLDKDVIKLMPDWDRYRELQRLRRLATLACWLNEELVGYGIFFLESHIHYKENLFARNDILFLRPDHRQGRLGITLIKECEQMLKSLNVSKVFWHVKQQRDFRVLLHRMGYKDEDIIVGKALKEA